MSDQRDGWPSRAAAASILGVPATTFERMIKRGELGGELVAGVMRFDPDELARLRKPATGDTVIAELIGALRNANQQAVALVGAVTLPAERLLALYGTEATAMRARIDTLESKTLAMLEVFERAVTEQHSREMARAAFEAGEKRKTTAFQALIEHGPKLAAQALGNVAIRDLWESLDEDQIAALSSGAFLTDAQRAMLAQARAKASKTAPAPAPAPEAANGKAEADHH